jgi:hypothetical protein
LNGAITSPIFRRRNLCSISTRALSQAEQKLHINSLEDWYSVTADQIATFDLPNELKGKVLAEALVSLHPHHPWQPWRFKQQTKAIWSNNHHIKSFLDACAVQLGISTLGSWHDVKPLKERLYALGGSVPIEEIYGGSIFEALSAAYPDHKFARWKFGNVPASFWKDRSNLLDFFEFTGKSLGITKLEEWYRVRKADFVRAGGSTVLVNHFDGSLMQALKFVYPDHEWHPWRRATVPKSFWTQKENVRQFLDWLGHQLGIQKLDDWYLVTKSQVSTKWPRIKPNQSGHGTRRFHISLAEMLMQTYPSHSWLPWKFVSGVPMSYWDSIENQRKFFDWLLRHSLNQQLLDAWYSVPYGVVVENGGLGLLANKYGASLVKALRSVYPEHKWLEWKFLAGVSKSFWEERSNQVEYLEWLSEQLGLSSLDDWYDVPADEIKKHAGAGLLKHHGHKVANLLSFAFPSHKWEAWRFIGSQTGR